jgi:hypothetical protein
MTQAGKYDNDNDEQNIYKRTQQCNNEIKWNLFIIRKKL